MSHALPYTETALRRARNSVVSATRLWRSRRLPKTKTEFNHPQNIETYTRPTHHDTDYYDFYYYYYSYDNSAIS